MKKVALSRFLSRRLRLNLPFSMARDVTDVEQDLSHIHW
jgi:hypothetical protein